MTTHSQPAELATTDEPQVELDIEERRLETEQPSLLIRVGAELVGTFFLVTAIVVVAGLGTIGSSATVLYVALAGGLALAGLVAAFGSVSGAHLNPAVSIGAAVAGRLSWIDLAPYVVAQTLGAVGAGALLRALVPSTLPAALGLADTKGLISTTANGFGTHSPIATASGGAVTFSTAQALLVEAVATALLVGVVLAVTRRPNPVAPIAIGGALTVAILLAAQITNAAINPARATGVAFFADSWALSQLWLFWLAPVVGGLIAGLVALIVENDPAPVAEEDWDDEDEDDEDDDLAPAVAAPAVAGSDETGHGPATIEIEELEASEDPDGDDRRG